MIPQEKSAAVTRALGETFGVTQFENIRRLTRDDSSSLVWRIVVQGRPYLLKFIMRTSDPGRKIACMRAASEAGLAPHVWYTSVEDRIFIADFVDPVRFPVTDALLRMPVVLRRLHALPPFPEVADHLNTTCMFLLHKGPALDAFIQKFRASNILPKGEREELFAQYAQLAAVYPRHDSDMVSSHNDLFKPDNILFDGHRVWLVDWEAAFLNDRYADLAVVANLIVTNEAEEAVYLQEYFGQPPDEYQLARFFLSQQIAHIFYCMAFLWLGSSGEPVNLSEKTPEFKAFHQRMWAGEIDLRDKQTKTVYGRVHWEQLLRNTRQARFNESLKTISDRHRRL
jgi:hypothetical protein